jgi:hypothetical protein
MLFYFWCPLTTSSAWSVSFIPSFWGQLQLKDGVNTHWWGQVSLCLWGSTSDSYSGVVMTCLPVETVWSWWTVSHDALSYVASPLLICDTKQIYIKISGFWFQVANKTLTIVQSLQKNGSWDSSVSIVTRLQAGRPASIRSRAGAHPASYPMGTRGSFPGGKVAEARSLPLSSILVTRLRMRGAICPLPHTHSWRGALLSTGTMAIT